jgi:hypothetical protein
MPIQLRTDTSAAEHNLRKSWPFAPNPVHFADCTRFLRTTALKHLYAFFSDMYLEQHERDGLLRHNDESLLLHLEKERQQYVCWS